MRDKLVVVGILALALSAGGCNRERAESPDATADGRTADVNRAADRQEERNEEISRLDKRVAEIEQEYAEKNQQVASGEKTPTAELREEIKEDVTNVKQAVNDLRTTTPDNWWDRHEKAMKQAFEDVEADVARLAGKPTPARPSATTEADGEIVSTEPFQSRRDKFVADMKVKVDALERSLDNVKAKGARETEVDDVRARVKKLGEDVDRLKSASADDWWDVTKSRVTEYVDRIDQSIDRLDDRG